MAEVEENLQGRQGDVYDLIINNAESDKYTSTIDISNQLNITSNKALRTLKALERKGLIKQEGVKNQNNKGRPIALFRPTRGTELSRGFNDFNDFNETKTLKTHKTPDLSTPTHGIKVQRLKDDGEWQHGWIIADSTNPSDITIARMGSPHLTAQHYRWQINLKPTT
jgi:predicted transcriptional regulator